MKHTASFTLDKDSMSESFDQARRYGSRWHLIEMALGSVFILGGLALLIYADWATVLPVVLVVIGTIEIVSGRIKKFFWLRKHGKGKGVYFYIPEVVAGPDAIRFLALPPGWRFLIDGGL